jgi:hypothetical protein
MRVGREAGARRFKKLVEKIWKFNYSSSSDFD